MNKHNYAIKFDNVTKDFSKNNQKTFKEFLPALLYGEKTVDKFTVFSDISFEIKKGECVGIIGPNGSGKSTILKLIAGVMSPNKGKVHVHGKVSPLIELGAGMHPELTGRENIYLNGAILGLSRVEIDKNFQSILDFSELSEFIDQPIKHYSSGMYMRLAFSIAIHVDPEVLIVDEILAVGDSAFQDKCFAKMEEFKRRGVTIIFVSHNIKQVESFCNRVLYINFSKLIADGKPETVIEKYNNNVEGELIAVGDGHTAVFDFIRDNLLLTNFKISTCVVGGASPMGKVNPNRKTDAIKTFLKYLETKNRKSTILIQLGEADCGFIIWYRHEKSSIGIEEQFHISLDRYKKFVTDIKKQGFTKIVILGSVLPTIKDNTHWGSVSNLRKEIKATLVERTKLTIRYNEELVKMSKTLGVVYVDTTKDTLDIKNGEVKTEYRDTLPTSHQISHIKTAPLWISELHKHNVITLRESSSKINIK